MDISGTGQDEFRTAAIKINMQRSRDIPEYITKHRILRNDMNDARCEEIVKAAKEERTFQ